MSDTASSLSDDPAVLKAIVAALPAENAKMSATLRAHDLLVQSLRIRIAKLQKQKFGASSEKVEREIEQLELALEALEVAVSSNDAPVPEEETEDAAAAEASPRRRKPKVGPETPRERVVLDPGGCCPDCGGELRLVGEDVSEILELITAKLKVIETARPKKSCRRCEKITQTPAPSRPIPRSIAGPGLLAHILVSKFDDHLPLYRQNEIFTRMGADIPGSTLEDWCGQGMRMLGPLVERIKADVLGSDRLHADDTPIRVLNRGKRAQGLGKGVKEGRIWTYLRDDRPWNGPAPPGIAYFFSLDRKSEHPKEHLARFEGILQADAYSGFRALYDPDATGQVRVREAACWAHLRRDFHDVWTGTDSGIAKEALDRIGALYDIEREIAGRPAEDRREARQARSKPKVEALGAWMEAQLGRVSGKSDLAKAFRYALKRWPSFTLFLEDGRVAIDNNAAERAIKPVVIGRKNWLFAGADAGGETLADAMTIIESAKLSGHDPEAYLADIFHRIHDYKINRINELLPWNWTPDIQITQAVA